MKTSRALARKRDHRDHNARQWRAMTFIPASFMKLFIRYREELKRSVRVLWSLPLAVCQTAKERECAVKHESVLLMEVLVMVSS